MIRILGGGIAGASLAYALAVRKAPDVLVVDPNPPGWGSTVRATGGFRTQFVSSLNIELSLASRRFFEQYATQIDFRSNGYAYLAFDEVSTTLLSEWRRAQIELGLPVISANTPELFPGLTFDDVTASNYCALDGVYDPSALLDFFRQEAVGAGARFHYGAQRVLKDHAADDTVVVAAGRWSRDVGHVLGVTLDVRPEERRVWLLGGTSPREDMPLGIDMEGGWVFRERDGALLLVSPPVTQETDAAFDAWVVRHVRDSGQVVTMREWTCFYENTFDHHPLVGRTSRAHVWASCGFSGHGIMHAPAIADSLAAMMLGDTPAIDVIPLSPLRDRGLAEPTVF
ncbi:MAG TPA: FAD-binding oxidoreductase [Chloroflexota bacterium]|jgi:sarcosine oxidase subunit beta|nr:FAD-binding oxidoreductase [Chloroflexota bacterium]